mmetsp:Transcript_25312/g.68769  ORF Transcript_25312/g.68769 Transcript_25312/m.68769 type:complete len:373 (+) Transcript_25312:154-1272(+)
MTRTIWSSSHLDKSRRRVSSKDLSPPTSPHGCRHHDKTRPESTKARCSTSNSAQEQLSPVPPSEASAPCLASPSGNGHSQAPSTRHSNRATPDNQPMPGNKPTPDDQPSFLGQEEAQPEEAAHEPAPLPDTPSPESAPSPNKPSHEVFSHDPPNQEVAAGVPSLDEASGKAMAMKNGGPAPDQAHQEPHEAHPDEATQPASLRPVTAPVVGVSLPGARTRASCASPNFLVPREICSAQEGRQRGVLPGRARPSPLSSPQEQQQRQQQQQQLLQPLTAGHCATAESVMRPIKGKRLTTQLAPPRDYSHRQWQAEMRDARPERSSFNGPRGRFLSAGGFPGWKFHQSRSQQQQQQQQQQQRVREDFQLCGTTVS